MKFPTNSHKATDAKRVPIQSNESKPRDTVIDWRETNEVGGIRANKKTLYSGKVADNQMR